MHAEWTDREALDRWRAEEIDWGVWSVPEWDVGVLAARASAPAAPVGGRGARVATLVDARPALYHRRRNGSDLMSTNPPAAAAVSLTIGLEDDGDAAEIERLTQRLRRELLELDVAGVERPRSQDVPGGAKAVDFAHLGELVVTMTQAAPAVAALAGVLQRWIGGGGGRRLRVEIDGDVLDLSSASAEQQEAALALFLERHAEGRR